ncbi:MAG: DUF6114 domain-containing protein [Candidatus Bathyarchaeia archaeon]|jgi:hypothetical protein
MTANQGITFAYIVSLVGGLIILIASILNVVWYSSGAPNFGGYGSFMRGMMDGYHNFMGSYGGSYGFLAGISLVGVICGVIVLMGAIMLRVQPRDHMIWAIVIIVFSAISFVGMGGFFIGAILGIIGGAFDLSIRQIKP